MASKPCGPCCVEKTLHEGTPKGGLKTIAGLETYCVGEEHGNDNVLVICTDVFGHKFQNTQLIADQFAKLGNYKVLVPDILKGDPINESLETWFPKHVPEITVPIVNDFLSKVKQEMSPKFFVGVGYCFGAKYVIQHMTKDGLFDAGALAHPTFITEEEVEQVG